MTLRELSVLLTLCLVWGLHFVVIKLAVAQVPPMFYAASRMVLVALLLSPFLRWRRGQMLKVLGAGLCLGALNYALMFNGMRFATASASAIAVELYTPFATILSIIFLAEKVGWRRGAGIALALAGVAVVSLSKQEGAAEAQWLGVLMVAGGAFIEAVGAILVKRSKGFRPVELLAWFAVVGAISLTLLTLTTESGQIEAFAASDKEIVIGAFLYSALIASLVGHTAYYWLIQRLPLSQVAPSALLTTIFAVGFSAWLLGDALTISFLVGGLMTMAGVGVVLFRSTKPKIPLQTASFAPAPLDVEEQAR